MTPEDKFYAVIISFLAIYGLLWVLLPPPFCQAYPAWHESLHCAGYEIMGVPCAITNCNLLGGQNGQQTPDAKIFGSMPLGEQHSIFIIAELMPYLIIFLVAGLLLIHPLTSMLGGIWLLISEWFGGLSIFFNPADFSFFFNPNFIPQPMGTILAAGIAVISLGISIWVAYWGIRRSWNYYQ